MEREEIKKQEEEYREKVLVTVRRVKPTQEEEPGDEPDDTRIWMVPRRWRIY